MTCIPVSMAEAASKMSITIRVTHVKRTRLRLWLFGLLLKAAVSIAPVNVDVVEGQS